MSPRPAWPSAAILKILLAADEDGGLDHITIESVGRSAVLAFRALRALDAVDCDRRGKTFLTGRGRALAAAVAEHPEIALCREECLLLIEDESGALAAAP